MIFVTGNEGKIKEFETILGYKINNVDLDLKEIQSVDVKEVAQEKARQAYEILKEPVIVDDTGLYLEELNGLPGALVKFFVKNLTLKQICNLVLENRKAKAITCIAFFNGKEMRVAEAEVKGTITKEPRGENGFGWDPIFLPDGFEKTFGELTSEEKQSRFMRHEAIDKLRDILTK